MNGKSEIRLYVTVIVFTAFFWLLFGWFWRDISIAAGTPSPEQGFYERNKPWIWGVGSFLVLEGIVVALLAANILRRRRAEKALRESEANLKEAQDIALMGRWEMDLVNNRLQWSDSIFGIFEIDPARFGASYEAFLSAVHPEDRIMVNKAYRDSIENRKPYDIMHRLLMKDGRIKWVREIGRTDYDSEGRGIRSVGIVQDVSEIKQAEEKLHKSEERYRDILESIEEGYYEVDLGGNVKFFNDSVCELLGYSREELMGMNDRQYTDPESAEQLFNAFHEVYRTGNPTKGIDWQVVRKDGTRRFIEASVSLMRDKEGNPIGFRGIARDVTRRRKAEEERKTMEAQLQQAQKMEAIGTLAGGVAHDFNNLLMGIQGRASLMAMDTDSSHPHYEHLKGIEDYVKRAADLTRQLLGFARGGKYEVKSTDLNSLVDESATLFGRTKKEIVLFRKLQPGLWTVEVDRSQIEQVLLNLYVNAWQAMPSGGTLYVQTQNVVLEEDYTKLHEAPAGRYVKLSITDTGVGMDESTKQRIFDPFFSTKGMGRGTGLGLASAYGIIKSHKGIITVTSEKGHGSTFTIYLPASEKAAPIKAEDEKALVRGKGTILLVDDERMILDVGRPMLENLGYEVLAASGGKEALDIFRKKRDVISLVLLDMVMPQMGGGETFDQLKAMDPDVKVLLSSGYSVSGEAQSIIRRGCHGFIQKPFNHRELSLKLSEILQGG